MQFEASVDPKYVALIRIMSLILQLRPPECGPGYYSSYLAR